MKGISNRRARIVIEHILKHGFITTEELETTYGYNHPPRAARDVREAGIPLETFRVKDTEGRTIAAYRFGDLTQVRKGRLQVGKRSQSNSKTRFTKSKTAGAKFAQGNSSRVIYRLTTACRMKSLARRKAN